MPPPVVATLERVAALLGKADEPWWIIGSAAVALHGGAADEIGDIDVLLGTADALRLVDELGLARCESGNDPLFRSAIFARWTAPPLPVEFMAGLHVADAGQWASVVPQSRELIRCGDVMIGVPSRAELRAILLLFGRPKDLRRATTLV
ncbi:conserved hypothetical protein [Sphingomonas sp. EC-HK361]|uniref:hypothetical protein n=1 Tax=Sphingomonas sp. EC-HK361 TaxID=2038397 RepID=UPI00125AE608|nr:hypothetical protein [Sphingomonas sp. EC-HK361]VVT11143.1 conserved hypothetical protein [Sphingomonas sp. EC-HK361]